MGELNNQDIQRFEDAIKCINSDSSLLEDIGKVRSETAHTQFLASLFKKMGDSGVKDLLKIILSKDEKLKEKYDELKSIDNIDIQDLNVTPEYPIETKDYGKGNVDIVIQGKIQNRSINIIIENKIDAAETVKKNKENLYQTDAYYEYFTKNESFKNDINIFVYLKAVSTSDLQNMKPGEIDKGSCKNKNYVLLNYQELYERVILPYKRSLKRNSRDFFKIRDYIRALGLPTDYENKVYKTPIMAYSEQEKILLKNLVSNHSTILSEAFSVMADDATDDPGLCELYTTIADSLKSSKKLRTEYTAEGPGEFWAEGRMWDIVAAFAEKLLELGKDTNEINRIIQELRTAGSQTTSTCFAESKDTFPKYSNGTPRAKKIDYKGTASEYWLTDQWGASGTNLTFEYFKNNVMEEYKIEIKEKKNNTRHSIQNNLSR